MEMDLSGLFSVIIEMAALGVAIIAIYMAYDRYIRSKIEHTHEALINETERAIEKLQNWSGEAVAESIDDLKSLTDDARAFNADDYLNPCWLFVFKIQPVIMLSLLLHFLIVLAGGWQLSFPEIPLFEINMLHFLNMSHLLFASILVLFYQFVGLLIYLHRAPALDKTMLHKLRKCRQAVLIAEMKYRLLKEGDHQRRD